MSWFESRRATHSFQGLPNYENSASNRQIVSFAAYSRPKETQPWDGMFAISTAI